MIIPLETKEMARLEAKISVEKTVHSAFAELAQNIANEYGVQVNSVTFDWLDMSTASEKKLFVAGTNADTDCKV